VIVQAPMAGGPSTPELTAAVAAAGALGFVAGGYRSVDRVREDMAAVRELTDRQFGVNFLIAPPSEGVDDAVARYAERLCGEAERLGVALGEPRADDDARAEKIALAVEERPAVASFAFGCPTREEIDALHGAGVRVWVTVTEPAEARIADAAGVDALVVQGVEAGGHRGSFCDDDGVGEIGLLALLRLVAGVTSKPLVAAGGLMDREGVAAARAAGALGVQVGTAFMLCPEAGTSDVHRRALREATHTALTRAFSGRRARGLVNGWMRDHGAAAPAAYPQVHHLTTPLRAAARAAGDGEAVNMWAGQGFALAQERPAAEVVRSLSYGPGANV
jgi:nitronate monooxygenase